MSDPLSELLVRPGSRAKGKTALVVVQRRPFRCWFWHQFGLWLQVTDNLQKKTCQRCGVSRTRWRSSVSKWLS